MSLFLGIFLCLFFGYFVWRFFTGKWQEVFVTQDVEQYMMVSGALQGAGLRYKSTTGGQEFNSRRSTRKDNLPSVSYSILVHDEKAYIAQQLINELVHML